MTCYYLLLGMGQGSLGEEGLELVTENLHAGPTKLSILVFVKQRIIAPTLAFLLNQMGTHLRLEKLEIV